MSSRSRSKSPHERSKSVSSRTFPNATFEIEDGVSSQPMLSLSLSEFGSGIRETCVGIRDTCATATSDLAKDIKASCWPLEICCCLPPSIRNFIPRSWTLIQGWTHLILLAGIFSAIFILGEHVVIIITRRRCASTKIPCAEEILIFLSLIPCVLYMGRMVGRYDEQIKNKHRAVEEQKKELANNVDTLIENMDSILGKVTESSAMLAERNIESHRRAFQRFLQYAGVKFAQMALTEEEAGMLLKEMKRLIHRWLAVFEECSVDPIGCPRSFVHAEEVDRCQCIPELTGLILERLKVQEVRFISSQKEQDAKMLAGLYTGSRRMTGTAMPDLDVVQSLVESNSEHSNCCRCCACPCGWMKIKGWGFSWLRSQEGSKYPLDVQAACFWCTVLSHNHMMLVIALFSGFFMVPLKIADGTAKDWYYLVAIFFYVVCVIVLLVRFEDIDLIQRLEREVQELTAENERIKTRQDQMHNFWDSVNDLTDLWVHRTVPRLELLKEVHGHLEDAGPGHKASGNAGSRVIAMMKASNDQLESLEDNLLDLNAWRSNGAMGGDMKKMFGENIMALCRGSTMDGMFHGLKGVIEDMSQCHPHHHANKDAAAHENKEFEVIVEFLERVPLIMRLPKDQHPLVAAVCKHRDFAAGQVIIQQGDVGKEFFVIRSGEAQVTCADQRGQERRVAKLSPGDYVGETALLRDEPRTATVTALTAVSALTISQKDFEQLGLQDRLQFANRRAVGGGGKRRIATKPPTPKTKQEQKLITEALWRNENIQTMVQLSEERVQNIMNVTWKEKVEAGTVLMKEGDLNADYFYIVQEGSFDIYVTSLGKSTVLYTAKPCGSFGELALLYLTPRSASVKATSPSVVWVIDRMNFKEILVKVSEEKISEYVKILDKVEILSALLAHEKRSIANALNAINYRKGEVILQQGAVGTTFYILYDGEVSVTVKGKGQVAKLSARTRDWQANSLQTNAVYFGERALFNEEMRTATVTVTSSTASVLALDRESFNCLLGSLGTAMTQHKQTARKTVQGGQGLDAPEVDLRRKETIRFEDLKLLGFLGCGTFGYVELYEQRSTGNTYAMKTLSKGFIVRASMQESVLSEKKILMMTNSPFIIKLFETFRHEQTVSFLLEPALGGELLSTYKGKSLYGSEPHCKFYMACVTMAFEHLHARRILYRDLKPENLVLNKHGFAKLVDLGLAKFVIGKTFTTCGTPEYFSPEMISSTGHTNAVDWWALGIFIFELMVGHTPFISMHPMGIYSNVTKGINTVKFPPKCQGPVQDLIKELLVHDPAWRLPMRPGGVENMKNHAWTSLFDWEGLRTLTVAPPYKPSVRNKKDLTNVTARKEDMPKLVEYIDDGSEWDLEFAST